MAFMAPVIAAVAPALGGTAAAGIGTALSVGGAIYGGIAQHRAASFQQDMLASQAAQDRLNAEGERARGAVAAQDKDFDALAQMENILASQAGSGFDVKSGSFERRRAKNRVLAKLDRTRIVEDAETRATNLEQRAAGAEIESQFAGQGKTNAIFNTITGVGSSLITGAGRINDTMARKVRRDTSYKPTSGWNGRKFTV